MDLRGRHKQPTASEKAASSTQVTFVQEICLLFGLTATVVGWCTSIATNATVTACAIIAIGTVGTAFAIVASNAKVAAGAICAVKAIFSVGAVFAVSTPTAVLA